MKGFTLLELVVVLIILGILASLGMSQYGRTVERSRQAEAISILGAMRGSQLRFAAENNALCTATMSQLDIDLPDNNADLTRGDGRYFNYTVPGTVCNTTDATNSNIALATRNGIQQTGGDPSYNVAIAENGNLTCASGVGTCSGGP